MSSFIEELTPVILTGDEEPNIGRTLAQLRWAHRIVVCDSMSQDRTLEIAREFPNVEIYQRPFDDLAMQWRFALAQARTEWIFALDADYFVPEALASELAELLPAPDTAAYTARFQYSIGGRTLRGSLYPPRPVLLRRDQYEVFMDGHTHRYQIHGGIASLRAYVIHDDRKDLRRFIARQKRYMRQEAVKLRTADPRTLNAAARLRRLRVLAPFIVIPYTLIGRKLIFDGIAGLHYTFERFLAEAILSVELFRSRSEEE